MTEGNGFQTTNSMEKDKEMKGERGEVGGTTDEKGKLLTKSQHWNRSEGVKS